MIYIILIDLTTSRWLLHNKKGTLAVKMRTPAIAAALLLALCLLLSACGGGDSGTRTEAERQAVMDAEREAAQALSEAAFAGQKPEQSQEVQKRVIVTADSPERLLYRDDTRIVYTVETPADCTEVIMSLLYRNYGIRQQMQSFTQQERLDFDATDSAVLWAYNTPMSQLRFTPQSEGVTVEKKDTALVWTIPCDFGFTGAERVSAEAVCPGDDGMHPFGIANVSIRYPNYNIVDEVETAIRAAIAYNQDAPLYFVCDLSETSLDFDSLDQSDYTEAALFGLQRTMWEYDAYMADLEARLGTKYGAFWDYATKDPEVYSGNLYMRWPYYAQIVTSACTNSEYGTDLIPLTGLYVPEGEGVLLCGIRLGNEDPLLPEANPEWLQFMIEPGTRAAICHQAGITVNAEDFPAAAAIQAEAEAAISQCIQPGMTDFEKAKAIFDWMYKRGKSARLPAYFSGLSESVQNIYYKSACGFMTAGFGDCMGWSDTFSVLCSMAGIKCVCIDCAATPGGAVFEPYNANHRMNALWLDGEMYYADAYWGAAGSDYSKPQYQYFLLTSEQAAKYYTWDGTLGIPETNATKYALDPVSGKLLG